MTAGVMARRGLYEADMSKQGDDNTGVDTVVRLNQQSLDIERAYHSVTPNFDLWVRTVEIDARKREALELASAPAQKVLIVSPPTDTGIRLLAEANSGGTTTLLCFSERLRDAAEAYQRAAVGFRTELAIAPFFRTGFDDATFTAIYANCFFDFLREENVGSAVNELRRILKPGGRLFAVYMDRPLRAAGHAWARFFGAFKMLSGGCHPISIREPLLNAEFVIESDDHQERLGFPMRFTVAQG